MTNPVPQKSQAPRPLSRGLSVELAFWLQRPLPGIGGISFRNHAKGRPLFRVVQRDCAAPAPWVSVGDCLAGLQAGQVAEGFFPDAVTTRGTSGGTASGKNPCGIAPDGNHGENKQ